MSGMNQFGKKEIILTAELMSRFSESDPVLHQRYRIGDKLMMCGTCHRIIRSELLDGTQCPYDTRHTFNPVAVLEIENTLKLGRKRLQRAQTRNAVAQTKWFQFAYFAVFAASVTIVYCVFHGIENKAFDLLMKQLGALWYSTLTSIERVFMSVFQGAEKNAFFLLMGRMEVVWCRVSTSIERVFMNDDIIPTIIEDVKTWFDTIFG